MKLLNENYLRRKGFDEIITYNNFIKCSNEKCVVFLHKDKTISLAVINNGSYELLIKYAKDYTINEFKSLIKGLRLNLQ